jgi:hypothetical protein
MNGITEILQMNNKKEQAIWSMFEKQEHLLSMLIILKDYIKSDKYIAGHAEAMLEGLVSKVIIDQIDMINEAGIKY